MGCCSSIDESKLPYHEHDILSREAKDIADTIKLQCTADYADAVANEDSSKIKEPSLSKARQFIETLRDGIIDAYKDIGDDITKDPELDSWFDQLNFHEKKEEVLNAPGTTKSVKEFTQQIVDGVMQNPIMVAALAEIASLDYEKHLSKMVPPASPERDIECRRFLTYAYFLNNCTTLFLTEKIETITGEKSFARWSVEHLIAEREARPWEQYLSDMERSKVFLVAEPVVRMVPVKEGKITKDTYVPDSPTVLAYNILWAMYLDVTRGNLDNPESGFELMVEPPDRDPIPGLGNKPTEIIDEERGLAGFFPSLPKAWADLYMSWNAAHMTGYLGGHVSLGKLVFPALTRTYQKQPEYYIIARAFALMFHLHVIVFRRERMKGPGYDGLDLRDPMLRLLWGKVNRFAAEKFQERVEDTIAEHNGLGRKIIYKMKRASTAASWGSIRATTKARTSLGQSMEDDTEIHDHMHEATEETLEMTYDDHSKVGSRAAAEKNEVNYLSSKLREEYSNGDGMEIKGVKLQPFDVIYTSNASYEDDLAVYADGSKSFTPEDAKGTSNDFSLVALVLTSDCFLDPKPKGIKDNTLYLWNGQEIHDPFGDPEEGEEMCEEHKAFLALPKDVKEVDFFVKDHWKDSTVAVARMKPEARSRVDAEKAMQAFGALYRALEQQQQEEASAATEPTDDVFAEVSRERYGSASFSSVRVAAALRQVGFLQTVNEGDAELLEQHLNSEEGKSKSDDDKASIKKEMEDLRAKVTPQVVNDILKSWAPINFLRKTKDTAPLYRHPWVLCSNREDGFGPQPSAAFL